MTILSFLEPVSYSPSARLDNELMRLDCYAILKDGRIASLAERMGKTIR